jgi:hypothetical protein
MPTIGVAQLGTVAPRDLAARSRAALDRSLAHDAELVLARASEDAVLAGAFQRGAEIDPNVTLHRRGSGGAPACVGEGTLWLTLALARPSALVACEPTRIVNRYVRPLLRVISKLGASARYFGRDWISVAQRPAALVMFAHDSESGRAVFEAFVSVRTPLARVARASFTGKAPATLEEILQKPIDIDLLAHATATAYAAAYAREIVELADVAASEETEEVRADPPWKATRNEAIGIVGAGRDARGRFQIGGELLASRDAVRALGERVGALGPRASDQDIARAVNDTLAAPGIAVDGVRALGSVVDVVTRALRT